MPNLTCLITGCALVDPLSSRWVWGDLHKLGDAYIFNACLAKGETDWQSTSVRGGRKVSVFGNFFERRGVIVFNVTECSFNLEALEHLK